MVVASSASTSGAGSVRLTDVERHAALDALRQHCVGGALTLDEFSDRASEALEAQSHADLERLTSDLPVLRPEPRLDRSIRRVVAILGSNRRKGRWRLGERVTAVAIGGASWLDLRGAQVGEGIVTIRAFALLGTVKVFVPAGIDVELIGVPILGAKVDRASGGPALPGAPLIRIKGFPLLGSVRVLNRPPAG